MQDQRLEWLKPKMDKLFEMKTKTEAKGDTFSGRIQAGREYRNPRICEKLIDHCHIKQYGTNFPRDQFDPEGWRKRPEAFYDSGMYRRLVDEREREKQAIRY